MKWRRTKLHRYFEQHYFSFEKSANYWSKTMQYLFFPVLKVNRTILNRDAAPNASPTPFPA